MGLDGIHPRIMRELAEELNNLSPLFIISSGSPRRSGGPRQVEVNQCETHSQEVLEGGAREWQACQPDLNAWQGYGADLH